jgi:hypothetical protein
MIGPQPARDDGGVDRRVAKFVWKRQKIMRRKALPQIELRVSGRFALEKLLASLPLRIAMVLDLQPVRMLREIQMGVVFATIPSDIRSALCRSAFAVNMLLFSPVALRAASNRRFESASR